MYLSNIVCLTDFVWGLHEMFYVKFWHNGQYFQWMLIIFAIPTWGFLQQAMHVPSLSHVWHFVTFWTVTHQAPLSMGILRQGYWSGLPLPSPGDLPDPGIKSLSLFLINQFILIGG